MLSTTARVAWHLLLLACLHRLVQLTASAYADQESLLSPSAMAANQLSQQEHAIHSQRFLSMEAAKRAESIRDLTQQEPGVSNHNAQEPNSLIQMDVAIHVLQEPLPVLMEDLASGALPETCSRLMARHQRRRLLILTIKQPKRSIWMR